MLFDKHVRRRGLRPLRKAGHRAGSPYNEYTYDDLERLTDVEYHDSDTEAFVMDLLGNRTGDQTLRNQGQVTLTVEFLTNRCTPIAGSPVTHDEAGNLILDRQESVYFHDYENRVVKIKDSSSNDVAEYAYDALGRRIRMIDKAAEPGKRGLTPLITSQLWQRAQNHFRPDILYYADNLPCNGESNWLLGGMMDYTHDVFRSHVRMINLYRMYLKSVRFKVAKHCTAGCCDHLRVKFKGRFEASDTVDFNPGQFFNIPGTGHRIADSLIIACYDAEDGHNDFVIHSESDEETTAYMECP